MPGAPVTQQFSSLPITKQISRPRACEQEEPQCLCCTYLRPRQNYGLSAHPRPSTERGCPLASGCRLCSLGICHCCFLLAHPKGSPYLLSSVTGISFLLLVRSQPPPSGINHPVYPKSQANAFSVEKNTLCFSDSNPKLKGYT